MMKVLSNKLLLLTAAGGMLIGQVTMEGIVNWCPDSLCMDDCSVFCLEPSPDQLEFASITSQPDPWVLTPYLGEYVQVTGEMITCFLCEALDVLEIEIIDDFQLVTNSDFEQDGQPDLENWDSTCFVQSVQDAPPGGGMWSLGVEAGNYQGCFPGFAWQIITDPEVCVFRAIILNVSGWMKQASTNFGPSRLGLGFISDNGVQSELSAYEYSGGDWQYVTYVDTLFFEECDYQYGVFLDGGNLTGPATNHTYFDQISVQIVGNLHVGDLNGDGEITVLDIVWVVSIILGTAEEPDDYQLWAADYNTDGFTNILDIISMIFSITG
ncbi:MAG: hypothetical protein H8D46_04220 [FCB group bacterium]|nr:hypothetical protein [FCB group bacterium]